MRWKAILSDNTVCVEDRSAPSCWRKLKNECQSKDLKIEELHWNDVQIHPGAEAYFVFFDALGFMYQRKTFTKIAIGCLYKNNKKYRINWYDADHRNNHLYTEVGFTNNWESLEIANDLRIERYGYNIVPETQTIQRNTTN